METITTAEQEQKEPLVLKVCLDEIERSRPFLLVLLGDPVWLGAAGAAYARGGGRNMMIFKTKGYVELMRITAGDDISSLAFSSEGKVLACGTSSGSMFI